MIKTLLSIFLSAIVIAGTAQNVDTLAFQDFEVAPQAPVWNFTGPVIYNSGYSSATAAPANSPIGINGSRAWETTTNSGGLVLDFANTIIPSGYDSVRVRFNLAAMNLLGATGGPDNLDYVLVAYSTDGGTTYSNRIRVRGAVNNNSFWPYSATGFAQTYYLPATETVFQPLTTGLQTTLGYSTVEIVFPGSLTQIALRITGRSSSSTDTWLVDNLVLTGENLCVNSTASINVTTCGSYTTPSGNIIASSGIYHDTIQNFSGCDSVITINATINQASTSNITLTSCGPYTSPSGNVLVASGVYSDTIANVAGCDSVISINLTINQSSIAAITENTCTSYTAPSGAVYTLSGVYNDTIQNLAGCDSIITITLQIDTLNVSTSLSGATITANQNNAVYQWIDCNNGNLPLPGETNQSFTPSANGDYAVIITNGSCSDTSACVNVISTSIQYAGTYSPVIRNNTDFSLVTISGLPNNQNWNVNFYDASGRVAIKTIITDNNSVLTTESLASGIYMIEIFNQNFEFKFKYAKQ